MTHAVLMGLAWLLLAPLGVVIARYTKAPPVTQGAPARWFLLHRGTQIAAVLLTAVGVPLAIASTGDTYAQHLFNSHTVMGVVVSIFAFGQSALGVIRPSKASPHRALWSNGHKVLGYATSACAVVTCILGADEIGVLYKSANGADDKTGQVLVVVFSVLGGLWLVCMAVLELRAMIANKSTIHTATRA